MDIKTDGRSRSLDVYKLGLWPSSFFLCSTQTSSLLFRAFSDQFGFVIKGSKLDLANWEQLFFKICAREVGDLLRLEQRNLECCGIVT